MSKELSPLEAFYELGDNTPITDTWRIVETALKEYQELSKIEYRQNTINDFYPSTKEMIDDLLNLISTKMCDFLKDEKSYTKASVLETLGSAIRYVKTFAYGGEFNENEKIGVNAKKLKAFEIIKNKQVDVELLMKSHDAINYNIFSKNVNQSHNLGQREFDFLKEELL